MANGEGYLRRRGKNSWTMTIWLGRDATGKPRQLTKTVRGTEKEAQAEMARLILERNQGIDLRPETVTVNDLFIRWLKSKTLAPSTSATYEVLIKTHILPAIGHLNLSSLRPLHIEAVKENVLAAGCSSKSALNVFRVLNASLRQAVRWQLISRNPCDSVDAPRPRRFVAHAPTPEELGNILAVADTTPYGPVARLAALSGLRQAELLGLVWRDVDWQNLRLTVQGTKTEGSYRIVDLGPLAMGVLTLQHQAEREKWLRLGPSASCGMQDATIFTNLVGRPMDAGGLKRTWKRIIRDAGVGHVRFHDLRHAAATYQIQAGVPIVEVSNRMGHTRTSTTTDMYGHLMPGGGRAAAEALEAYMVNAWSKMKEA